MRYFLRLLPILAALIATDALANTAYRRYLRDLASNREQARERAETALLNGGKEAATALGEYMNTQPKSYREAAFRFLPRIPNDAGGAVLAERLVAERNDKMRAFGVNILKKNPSKAARDRLLEIILADSRALRREAAAVVVTLDDPSYLDALIDRLAEDLKEQASGSKVGLNVGVSRLDGFDTYKRVHVIQTPNGPKKVTQNIRMPRISGTSVSTQIGLPANQALVEITGKNFGDDVSQWRAYRHQRYGKK